MNRIDAAVYVLTLVLVSGALVSINHMSSLYGPAMARIMFVWSLLLLGVGFLVQRGVRAGYKMVER